MPLVRGPSLGSSCQRVGRSSPALAAARPQAQNAACGDNASSLGGDEALSIQIEPIAWYPGYSPLGEQSRHKHGNRPNLAVLHTKKRRQTKALKAYFVSPPSS